MLTITDLDKKNIFVRNLREYLKEKYQTEDSYTFGEGDFEGKMLSGGGCALVRKDLNAPEDLRGFCFRKDLCLWSPSDKEKILMDIDEFAKKQGLEIKLESNKNYLILNFGKSEYLVSGYIEGGYAGEIDIDFSKSFDVEIILKELKQTPNIAKCL